MRRVVFSWQLAVCSYCQLPTVNCQLPTENSNLFVRLLVTILLLFVFVCLRAQHPVTFFTKAEAAAVKKDLNKYPLLTQSFNEIKKDVDAWTGKDIDVPLPKDAGGGYTHDRHKANYMLMFNSGVLYNLTGDAKYAALVKGLLMKYAALNPTLKKHPQATSSSPGHIFWQALNDANWLVYSGMAYDLIKSSLTAAEIKAIEDGAFKPEVDFFTKDLKNWFNLIHNHGVWACAGVGIVGIATDNKEYVDMALYGTEKNGKSGLIAQMDNLFAPDGYYTEGPYYVRYAILPYYLFANALQHARPELKVFEHRNRILQKALLAGLQQTNLDGRFFPLNDAIKDKDYTTNEMITAIDIAWDMYGRDEGLMVVANKQGHVLLNKGGASVAAAIATAKSIPDYYPYKSVEFTDGVKGDEGGVSLMRNSLTTLIFKYTAHGLSHGHFDKLNINLFDKGNEVLTDYGSARFVNIEQKYGGRYLPENDGYATQTIAHNTIVVDEASHFNGDEKTAEKYHSEKLFSDVKNNVVAAKETNAYKGVRMQRNLYMIDNLIVDVFNVNADAEHQYDLPFHYDGQIINTSVQYNAYSKKQEPLGSRNGYQFLWKEAEASVADTTVQLTFLNGTTFYTISSLIQDSAKLFFTRSGANDPKFNLRHEPAWIIREKGKDKVFVNVIEIHGKYDAVAEMSSNSYPSVKQIKLLQNDEELSVVEITAGKKSILIAQANKDIDPNKKHSFNREQVRLEWTGPYTIKHIN